MGREHVLHFTVVHEEVSDSLMQEVNLVGHLIDHTRFEILRLANFEQILASRVDRSDRPVY